MKTERQALPPDLVRRCIEGDAQAWQRLAGTQYTPIRDFLRWKTRNDDHADDLTQELFLKLLQNDMRVLRSFDPSIGLSIDQFLRMVAYRLFLDWAKSWAVKQEKRKVDIDELIEILSSGDATDARLLSREIEERIAALSPRQRAAVRLRLEGLSYAEIARALGMSIGGVGALLSRARRAFREGPSRPPRPQDASEPNAREGEEKEQDRV